jgi:hypothetical protein
LEVDVRQFSLHLGMYGTPEKDREAKELLRAALVARDAVAYDRVAHGNLEDESILPIQLTQEEKIALRDEKTKLFSERGILAVTTAVSLAAFLQGHVQSSINGATLYREEFGLPGIEGGLVASTPSAEDWKLGITNAAPFLSAALAGCWMALPLNEYFGRRGAIMMSAVLIFISSVASGLLPLFPMNIRWIILLGLRVVSGLGGYYI